MSKDNIEHQPDPFKSHLAEVFRNQPLKEPIIEMVGNFSRNGKFAIVSYFRYAMEDGCLEKAFSELEKRYQDYYQFQHPEIRGDLDASMGNEKVLLEMMENVGIAWPRPPKS